MRRLAIYFVKTINVERHECTYSVEAKSEAEAKQKFLTDGEQFDDDYLEGDVEKIVSVEEE